MFVGGDIAPYIVVYDIEKAEWSVMDDVKTFFDQDDPLGLIVTNNEKYMVMFGDGDELANDIQILDVTNDTIQWFIACIFGQ